MRVQRAAVDSVASGRRTDSPGSLALRQRQGMRAAQQATDWDLHEGWIADKAITIGKRGSLSSNQSVDVLWRTRPQLLHARVGEDVEHLEGGNPLAIRRRGKDRSEEH